MSPLFCLILLKNISINYYNKMIMICTLIKIKNKRFYY